MNPTPRLRALLQTLKDEGSPSKPGAEDIKAMDAREERLHILYAISGHTNGLLTGLHAEAERVGI